MSIPRIALNPLGGLSRYGMSPGEMKSLWRVLLRYTNAAMALRHTVKELKLSGVAGERILFNQFYVK